MYIFFIYYLLIIHLIKFTLCQIKLTNELDLITTNIPLQQSYIYQIPIFSPIYKITIDINNNSNFCYGQPSFPMLYAITSINYSQPIYDFLGSIVAGEFIYMIDSQLNLHILKIIIQGSTNQTGLNFQRKVLNTYPITITNTSRFEWIYKNDSDMIICIYNNVVFFYLEASTGIPKITTNTKQISSLNSNKIGGISYYDNILLIANGINGIDIYDLSIYNNSSINQSTLSLSMLNLNISNSYIIDIIVQDGILYVLDQANGIIIYKIVDNKNLNNNLIKINQLLIKGCYRIKLYDMGIIGQCNNNTDGGLNGNSTSTNISNTYIVEYLRVNSNDTSYNFIGPLVYNYSYNIQDFIIDKTYIILYDNNMLNMFYHSIHPSVQPNILDYNNIILEYDIKTISIYQNNYTYLIIANHYGYTFYRIIDTYATIVCNASLPPLSSVSPISKMNFTYYSLTCPQKDLYKGYSSQFICIYKQGFNFIPKESYTINPIVAIIIGLSSGLFVAFIGCSISYCYIKKMKKQYEKFKDTSFTNRNNKPGEDDKSMNVSGIILKNTTPRSSYRKRIKRPPPLNIELIEGNRRSFPIVMPRLVKLEKKRKEQERLEQERKAKEMRNESHKKSINNTINEDVDMDNILIQA